MEYSGYIIVSRVTLIVLIIPIVWFGVEFICERFAHYANDLVLCDLDTHH